MIKQCQLLQLSRSCFYYQPAEVSEEESNLVREVNKIHLQYPFYASRCIRNELHYRGFLVGCKKVQRFMPKIGIMALYPNKKTSLPDKEHHFYV